MHDPGGLDVRAGGGGLAGGLPSCYNTLADPFAGVLEPLLAAMFVRGIHLSKVITLTTDFSTSDAYVGAMKGVILSTAPDVTIVDLAHDVAPHDIPQAAFVLWSAYSYFPAGTIHVVVVDPGVGSARRRLAMRCGGYTFLGPDNGVLSYPVAERGLIECVEIAVPPRPEGLSSATFEGRDVFGPAAARIASGLPISELGPAVTDPVLFSPPRPVVTDKHVDGRITYIDHFGNCISDIALSDLAGRGAEAQVSVGGHSVGRLRNTYADVRVGDAVALINSVGLLEIAVNQGSAELTLNLKVGTRLRVTLQE